jgi:hypothetical protein
MWRFLGTCARKEQPTPPPAPPTPLQPATRDIVGSINALLDQTPIVATIDRSDEPVYGRADLPAGHCVCCAKPCKALPSHAKPSQSKPYQKAICVQCAEYSCGTDLVYCESHNTFQRQTGNAIDEKADEMSEFFSSRLAMIPEIEQIRGVVAMRKSPIDRHIIGKALLDMLGL